MLFRPGAIPIEDVIHLARHLILHGVMGDQPPEEFEGEKGEYSDKFDVRSFVYTAVAHLGMSESDAWNMTMTSFRAAMNAKFPQKEKAKVPTQEKYDEVMDWAEQMLAMDAQRHGPH
ncbi:gp17 protein [Salmonella enterica subsp. enterica serovar Montevideo str. ATCC BAA710]|nr:gp17 protein [Salmonella enterica subsp. enterica serovar Montevideo str. ATCC BAA710]